MSEENTNIDDECNSHLDTKDNVCLCRSCTEPWGYDEGEDLSDTTIPTAEFNSLFEKMIKDREISVQPPTSSLLKQEIVSNMSVKEDDLQKRLEERSIFITPNILIKPEITTLLFVDSDMGHLCIYNSKKELITNVNLYEMINKDIVTETGEYGCLFHYLKSEVELKYAEAGVKLLVKYYEFEGKTIQVHFYITKK